MFGGKFLRTGTAAYLAGLPADLCYFLSGEVDHLVKNKTPKIVRQEYTIQNCDLEECENAMCTNLSLPASGDENIS